MSETLFCTRDLHALTVEAAVLSARISRLKLEVNQCERGDIEITEVYDLTLGKKPLLTRREMHTRINRSAAVCYWREIRESEKLLSIIDAQREMLLQPSGPPSLPVEINFVAAPGDPADPENHHR